MTFAIVHPGFAGAMTVMTTSFFMSMMFPTIFALGVKGLGRNTKLGGALIVMSVAGGAVLPPVLGRHCARKRKFGTRLHRSRRGLYRDSWILPPAGPRVSLKSIERVPEVF